MNGYLTDIVKEQKKGHAVGAVSVCSATNFVVKAAMKQALKNKLPVLIEATANQVDQNGGYTAMTPADFASHIQNMALEVGFPKNQIILGGDHLGPLTRRHLHAKDAMAYADVLVREYALAGYAKIHLDTSMPLGSDPDDRPLPISVIAERGARLCKISEEAFEQRSANHPDSLPPLYVIGSEVPIPGGSKSARKTVSVTTVEHCRETFETYQLVFRKYGLQSAFDRVVALVVQTGAEFGDREIIEYKSEKARVLMEYGRSNLPFVFEGHSTDYQTTASLRFMVEDGIAFLKVGPALTFAFREALFTLEEIEGEIYYGTSWTASNFKNVLELAMLNNPANWHEHYRGNAREQRFARKYSLLDRARYYLNVPEVKRAINCLVNNINNAKIPLSLLSQYMPGELAQLVENTHKWTAENLIMARIGLRLDRYYKAIQPTTK